jgi:hypothetical protein
MKKIKIEKGIKAPKSGSGGQIYPWNEMEIGDSFYIQCDDIKRTSILTSGRLYFKYNRIDGVKVRSMKEGNGYRFWKISV